MASGHVNRANRPNTWPLRPTPQSEDSPCQPGAVHTWPIAPHQLTTQLGHREGQRQSVNKYGVGSELWLEPFPGTAEALDAYSPTYPRLYQPPRK